MALGLPSINIAFKQQGISAIKRGMRGIVALILKDPTLKGAYTLLDATEIPTSLSSDNKDLIHLALIGYNTAPTKIELFVLQDGQPETVNEALTYFESTRFDYLVYPEADPSEQDTMVSWIKTMRDTNGIRSKLVLAEKESDYEGVINVDDFIKTSVKTLSKGETTSRIAGLIAGTDLSISCTYAPINEAIDIEPRTKAETETAIGEGKLVFFKEAGKVKIARGVNSLVSTSQEKGTYFQKIKIVDIMDMINNDIRETARDYYIGKYANSYDNKVLLISAIGGYLDTLVSDGLIERDYTVEIDMEAQKAYLKSVGVDISKLTDQEIKEHNTADKVFLKLSINILDAIEEININVIL